MTAPEPVEVPAEELAAAELDCRNARYRQFDRRSIERVMAEYDRRGTAEKSAIRLVRQWEELAVQRGYENDQLSADLACALPVVEAAGAVAEHLGSSPSWKFGSGLTSESVELISRLGIAVRAAREPRTGEGG